MLSRTARDAHSTEVIRHCWWFFVNHQSIVYKGSRISDVECDAHSMRYRNSSLDTAVHIIADLFNLQRTIHYVSLLKILL